MGNKDLSVATSPATANNTINSTFYTTSPMTTTSTWPTITWNNSWPKLTDWTIGFDRQFQIFDELTSSIKNSSYPPYNIRKVDNDNYVLELAIAGFSKSDVEIVVQDQVLTITGSKVASIDTQYVHKGIGERDFTQRFVLAEYVEVANAELKDGILRVDLHRELPDEKKARTIKIK